MRVIAALSLVALMACPAIATASPCGGGSSSGGSSSGGSSGGGSSSGGSSSGGSSSDGSSSSSTPSCDMGNRIVGRNECYRFGSFDRRHMTRLRLGMHLLAGTASVSDEGFDGQAEHQEVHNYHYPAQSESAGSAAQMGAGGLEMQVGGLIGEHMLVGLYGSIETGSSNAPDRLIQGLEVRPGFITQFKTGGQLGVSIPLGSWLLRGDAMIGLRATGIHVESQIGDCIQQSTAWDLDLMVEPRVGLEKWLSPWLSAGVMVGSDVLRDRDMNVIIGLTGHSSAFDSKSAIALPK